YGDGAASPHNGTLVCDATASATSWTHRAVSPPPSPQQPLWISISGPDAQLTMHCDLHDLGTTVIAPGTVVQWLVNGQLELEQTLNPGATGVQTHISDLLSGSAAQVSGGFPSIYIYRRREREREGERGEVGIREVGIRVSLTSNRITINYRFYCGRAPRLTSMCVCVCVCVWVVCVCVCIYKMTERERKR
ncbi:hypothetical protein EGW08_009217, partial [Elysia chlorotica]